MLVASITDPESEHSDVATRREQVQALDNVAMLELHEWLSHMRFRLFGRSAAVGPTGRVEETFIISRVLLGFGEEEKAWWEGHCDE